MKKKVLAVILARAGSKGVKKKNIKDLCGHPLISYSIYAAKKSRKISEVVVSTDSKVIKKIAENYGALVPFLRPKKLALDHVWSRDALQHAVIKSEKFLNTKFDIVVELPAVAPLRDFKDIDIAIEKLIKTKADSVIGMTKVYDRHPIRIKRIVNQEIKDYNKSLVEGESSRRQELPSAYVRNGSIYAMKRDLIVKSFSRKGKKSIAHIMDPIKSINIDEMTDFYLAETLIKKNFCKNYPGLIFKNKTIKFENKKIKKKILISYNFNIAKKVFNRINVKDFGLIYCSIENIHNLSAKDRQNIIAWIVPTDGKIIIDNKIIKKFKNLKYVCSPSTGLTHIQKNISIEIIYLDKLKYTSNITASSEFSIGLLISAVRKFKIAQNTIESNNWRNKEDLMRGNELSSFSFGIFGFGRIGKNVANFLRLFNCKIHYFDPYVKESNFKKIKDFKKFMSSTNFLIVSARLNKSTYEKFNNQTLSWLKNKSTILNVSRGELFNEHHLIKLIKKGLISNYITDVIRNEEKILSGKNKILNFSKQSNKVLITPHIAGLTFESEFKALSIIRDILLKKLNN